jgi:hypothetical protein
VYLKIAALVHCTNLHHAAQLLLVLKMRPSLLTTVTEWHYAICTVTLFCLCLPAAAAGQPGAQPALH